MASIRGMDYETFSTKISSLNGELQGKKGSERLEVESYAQFVLQMEEAVAEASGIKSRRFFVVNIDSADDISIRVAGSLTTGQEIKEKIAARIKLVTGINFSPFNGQDVPLTKFAFWRVFIANDAQMLRKPITTGKHLISLSWHSMTKEEFVQAVEEVSKDSSREPRELGKIVENLFGERVNFNTDYVFGAVYHGGIVKLQLLGRGTRDAERIRNWIRSKQGGTEAPWVRFDIEGCEFSMEAATFWRLFIHQDATQEKEAATSVKDYSILLGEMLEKWTKNAMEFQKNMLTYKGRVKNLTSTSSWVQKSEYERDMNTWRLSWSAYRTAYVMLHDLCEVLGIDFEQHCKENELQFPSVMSS